MCIRDRKKVGPCGSDVGREYRSSHVALGEQRDHVLNDVSTVLWRERQLLELLVFKLEEEQLLLTAGKVRWVNHASREVELSLIHILVSPTPAPALFDRNLGGQDHPVLFAPDLSLCGQGNFVRGGTQVARDAPGR